MRLPTPDDVFGIFVTGIMACVLVLAGVGVYMAVSAATGTAKVDYCWISATRGSDAPVSYYINEHRPFATDAWVGPFSTVEEALKIATQLGCPSVAVEP